MSGTSIIAQIFVPLNKLDCSSLPPQPSIISYIHCSPDSYLFLCPPKKISICFLVSLIFPRFSKPLGRYHNVELFFYMYSMRNVAALI